MVPEIVRWQTPLAHMRRTATADISVARQDHQTRRQGGHVVRLGQRDEEAIETPNAFIIDRETAAPAPVLRLRHPSLRRQSAGRDAAEDRLGRGSSSAGSKIEWSRSRSGCARASSKATRRCRSVSSADADRQPRTHRRRGQCRRPRLRRGKPAGHGHGRGYRASGRASSVAAIELGVTFVDNRPQLRHGRGCGPGHSRAARRVFLSTKSSAGRGERRFTAANLSESLGRAASDDWAPTMSTSSTCMGSHPANTTLRRGLVPEMEASAGGGQDPLCFGATDSSAATRPKDLTRRPSRRPFRRDHGGSTAQSSRDRVFPDAEARGRHADHVAVRRSLSQPGALQAWWAGFDRTWERWTPAKIDAADPLGFLREARGCGFADRAAIASAATNPRRGHTDRHRET